MLFCPFGAKYSHGVPPTPLQTHCINSSHSPLFLPPHEVMNVGPHAAGEGSVKYLNNNIQYITLSKFSLVGVDSSKSQWSYL